MKNRIYYKKVEITPIDEISDKYGKIEFKSPYRSTTPLLLLFKSKLWNNFGLIENLNETVVTSTFECETPVMKGKGRPSCTDLMIETENICIAVEAKRTEPPYQSVIKWLGESENRKEVLKGWLEIIGDKIKCEIDSKLINDLPYQLIHRVASACSRNKDKTYVIYLGFDLNKSKIDYYNRNLDLFSKLLNSKIDIQLICFQINKSKEQKRLELLWESGERDLSDPLVKGVKNDTLMEFSEI